MRTITPTIETTSVATKPFAAVAPACTSLWDSSVSNAPGLVFRPIASWPAAAAALSGAAVTARPKSRVAATGVGYAGPAGAETRRGVDGLGRDVPTGTATGKRFIGTNGKQQDQLHLMSRRDPRTWRPPAD